MRRSLLLLFVILAGCASRPVELVVLAYHGARRHVLVPCLTADGMKLKWAKERDAGKVQRQCIIEARKEVAKR